MNNKIGIEEHYAVPDVLGDASVFFNRDNSGSLDISSRLIDLLDHRLIAMDDNGIEISILSLTSPGIQSIFHPGEAADTAKRSNDCLAETVEKRSDRFFGLAALPMQDPEVAISEMRRAILELGMVGVLVNGYSQIGSAENSVYLDDPMYHPFWAELEKLDVPFYLHPRSPIPENARLLADQPWFHGAAWAFGVETATHALRLLSSGLFDDFPNLKLLLGHLGEGLPFVIWRTDHFLLKRKLGIPAKRLMIDYLSENVWLTTSGMFHTPSFIQTILEVSSDRVLFATDYPYEDMSDASKWFDNCTISNVDKLKIGRQNAIDLFKLKM